MNFKKLFMEKSAVKYRLAKNISRTFDKKNIEIVKSLSGLNVPEKTEDQKKCLILAVHKGLSVREFRRMEGLVQRKEYYIYFGQNCFFDCQYCFLQCYSDNAVPTLFVNQDKILREVEKILKTEKKPFFYTGELVDSLLFDDLTDFNRRLIELFSKYPNGTLELRTKCVNTKRILAAKPSPNIIMSWTFTPEKVVRDYEKGTPLLDARIKASKRCQDAGFMIGLRLDPIIACSGWKREYETMISNIFSALRPEKIESAVLGVFRYHPALETVIRKRFPESDLLINEFVPCVDGKFRYFKPVRTEIYRSVIGIIRKRSEDIKISLCMETPEVWEAVMPHATSRKLTSLMP